MVVSSILIQLMFELDNFINTFIKLNRKLMIHFFIFGKLGFLLCQLSLQADNFILQLSNLFSISLVS